MTMTDTHDAIGEVTATRDDLQVVFHRRYGKPIEKVWAAITTPERLADWLAAAEVALPPPHPGRPRGNAARPARGARPRPGAAGAPPRGPPRGGPRRGRGDGAAQPLVGWAAAAVYSADEALAADAQQHREAQGHDA